MAISVFLSTVSDEFQFYRDQLKSDLTRHNVAVKVQEDFKDLGGDTLDKLDIYIAYCDAVVHLVGDMCGTVTDERQQQALLAKYSDLQSKLPPLGEALKSGASISYTQWEAWLALYHGKALLIAGAKAAAPRGPNFAPSDASRAAQAAHLARLKAFHRYPGSEFGSPDELAKQIAYTAILDLLAEDKAEKVAQARASGQDAKLDQILKKLAEDKSVPLETLRAILASMGELAASYDAAEIEQKLTAKAAEFRDLTDRLNRLSNSDPVVSQLRAEASAALSNGLFERADQLLAEAEARDLAGLEDLEALARQKRLSAADSRAQRAAAALLRINPDAYAQAAGHYREASRIAVAADALKAREYLRLQASTLTKLGDEFGDNAALHEAIQLLKAVPASGDRSRDPLDWAMMQDNLGRALFRLGERESETARLEEAVQAYLAALEERERGRVPLDWAATQTSLGNALARLGEREGEAEKLEQAVVAYRAALKERTRERVPLEWATTVNNLGNALWRLGERQSGTVRLEEAVQAYRAALEERPRKRVPLDWAATQNNLGLALSTLGERESGTARLNEAVEAYRAALKERTRGRVPLLWAQTQINLGAALFRLGTRGGPEHLEAAGQAYRAALEELTRDRDPLNWALAQNNLGAALRALGEQDSGTPRLEEAVRAYRAALEERTRERVPLEWAQTQSNLGIALIRLGERESGTETFKKAVQAYREALKERRRERVLLDWAASFGYQGIAMMLIADRSNDGALAEIAAQQIEAASETMGTGGQAQWAAYFESQLTKAQAIRDRLKVK